MGKVDQGFVALWVARHLFEGRLSYIGFGGSGKQVRDVLHVDDLCDLVTRQIARLDDVAGQVFNVGGGRRVSTSLCELTELCRRVTGKTIAIDAVAETRTADVPLYVTDTAKVEATLGWSPTRDPRAHRRRHVRLDARERRVAAVDPDVGSRQRRRLGAPRAPSTAMSPLGATG